jgi:hypothetical protein
MFSAPAFSIGTIAYLPSGFAQLRRQVSSHEGCHFRRDSHNSVNSVHLLLGERLGRRKKDDDFLWKPAQVVQHHHSCHKCFAHARRERDQRVADNGGLDDGAARDQAS